MVDKQRTDATDEDAEWNVDHPVDAEIEDGENEQGCVHENEEMIRPMSPFAKRSTLLFDMEVIQHQNPKWNRYMKARHGVVKRVVKGIEDGVPSVLIEQRIHTRNPRRGHFDVEEEVVRNRQSVDQEIVEGDLVGHVSVARIRKIDRCNIDEEEVNKQVVEVEKLREHIASKDILEPFGELAFNAVHPFRPVTGSHFHRFVQFVGDGLPSNDDDVAHGVQVVALLMKFRCPLAPRRAMLFLRASEKPANNRRQDQNHAHHDFIRVHGSAAERGDLCLRTIFLSHRLFTSARSDNL